MKVIRVFPRKTKATPDDDLVRINCGPGLWDEADEVHISVAFTYDLERAEELLYQWEPVAPVKIGGPALGNPSGEFVPGMYLKHGYTITSRGCPNKCWFCSVWRREPGLIELPIKPGYNILDDNLLACSERHIRDVFAMLKRQPVKATFTGGIEAKLLQPWHVGLFADLKPHQIFMAYDTPDDYEPLRRAAELFKDAGFNRNTLRAYVLIGYPKDTLKDAEKRLMECLDLGIYPMAMLYRDGMGAVEPDWRAFQRVWALPAIIARVDRSGFFKEGKFTYRLGQYQ